MNKKAGYAFRIVLGGYLAYLGIRMLIEMADERPSNMVFMCVMASIFTVIGAGYAIYSLKKVWELRKEEMNAADVPDEDAAEKRVQISEDHPEEDNENAARTDVETDYEER